MTSDGLNAMKGFYDYRLVTLSVLIAICAAYAALELASRTAAAKGRSRIAWLAGGATGSANSDCHRSSYAGNTLNNVD